MKKNLFSEFEIALGLSSIFSSFEFGMDTPVEVIANGETSDEEYLINGQKLLSLAKECMPKHRVYNDLAKKLAELDLKNLRFDEVISKISAVLRPLIKGIGDEVLGSEEVQQLHKLLPHLSFDLCTYDEFYEAGLGAKYKEDAKHLSHVEYWQLSSRRGRRFEDGEKVLYLICPQIFGKKISIGYQKTKENRNDGSRVLRVNRNHVIVDICHVLALMYMAEVVIGNFDKEDYRKSILYQGIVDRAGDAFNRKASYWSRDYQKITAPAPLTNKTIITLVDSKEKDKALIEYMKDKCMRLITVEWKDMNLIREYETAEILAEYIPPKELQRLKLKSCEKNFTGQFLFSELESLVRKTPLYDIPVFLKETDIIRYMMWNSADTDSSLLVDLITNRRGASVMPQLVEIGVRNTESLMFSNYLSIHEVLHREVEEIEKEKRDQADHARSFETKKNIPQKILKLMKDSILNERFGYLEYDEKCDTDKIGIVNTQLLGFVETYFPELDLKDISLRFRRLGNHKANGLYYPAYKCIAVELSHPSSFIHEFGHMLDYTQGKLSNCLNSRGFSAVYNKYVKLLDEKLELAEATALYKRGGKKSKYNYYTEETEVFARSFEVYITRVLKLDNTIVRTEEEFGENPNVYHPENEEYMQLVIDYFNDLPCMAGLVSCINQKEAA